MFKHVKIIVTVFASYLFSLGCGSYPCAKGTLYYGLIGFSDAESDTIIFRRFQKNTNTQIDSITAYNEIRFNRKGDTLQLAALLSDKLLKSDYDYQLFFPGANRTFSITEINEDVQTGGRGIAGSGEPICINPIISCKLNGQSNFTYFNTLYLTK